MIRDIAKLICRVKAYTPCLVCLESTRQVIEEIHEPSLQMLDRGLEAYIAAKTGDDLDRVDAVWRAMAKSILEDEH